ncbi:MAG: hypothetical protein HDR54_01130 [Treponema sp.]|nr:hypothetical protein [Treponema sp.]
MRKIFIGIMSAVVFLLVTGCSSALDEKNTGVQENKGGGATGFITITMSSENAGRKLDMSEIKSVSYTVESSGMNKITGTASVASGKGEFSINNIPVGKNRIISIVSNVSGFEISEVLDIKSGENVLSTINWITSAKANVYKKLLNAGKNIADFTDAQNSWISSAIPAGRAAYLVNVDLIVSDFETLKTGNNYVLNYGAVSFGASNAKDYVVCINDPCSESKKIPSDESGTYEITGVAPGVWNYTITDGDGKNTKKSVTVRSGETTTIDSIGNPLKGKLFVFVKASSAPKIWAWETTSQKVELSIKLNETWETQPDMEAASEIYMANPTGWYMKNFTNANPSGGEITFILNKDSEKSSGKTATFWYDGEKFYDEDPTANQLSGDTSLSDIKVNGVSIGTSTTNYTVDQNISRVDVTAIPTDPLAKVSVSPENTTIEEGKSATFTITVTAQNGNEKKYTLSVRRKVANDTSIATVKIGNTTASVSGNTYTVSAIGSSDELKATVSVTPTDSNAKVVCTPSSVSLKDGGTTVVKITVTNGTKSSDYTVNVSYKKSTTPQSQYYWTNKDGMVGTNKTIKNWSDWTSAEQIAQCAAYDDPRTWKGIQEVPYDVYALYAAYDDTNLYLLVELTNIADDNIFMSHDYAGSDNAWWDNRDLPIGFIISTDGITKSPKISGKDECIWGGVNFSDVNGFDYLLYHSSKYGFAQHEGKFVGVGTPGFFKAASSDGFSYDEEHCMSVNSAVTDTGSGTPGTSGIVIRYNRGCVVSEMNIYYESTPTDNRGTSKQTGEDLLKSTTYSKVTSKHNSGKNLDMSYWYTIPLSTIGRTKADLESKGIGVRQITTNGGSLMDCCPWDVSMVDNAAEPCSDDESTSREKEDVDDLTSPQARVGHL